MEAGALRIVRDNSITNKNFFTWFEINYESHFGILPLSVKSEILHFIYQYNTGKLIKS
jgi:hypothetical protein